MKQDHKERINILDNVNLERLYCFYDCWDKAKQIKGKETQE